MNSVRNQERAVRNRPKLRKRNLNNLLLIRKRVSQVYYTKGTAKMM